VSDWADERRRIEAEMDAEFFSQMAARERRRRISWKAVIILQAISVVCSILVAVGLLWP